MATVKVWQRVHVDQRFARRPVSAAGASPVSPASPDDRLAPWRDRWALQPDGPAFATPSSVLQPVLREGAPAFLKLATAAEEAAGGRVLRWWAGRGAATVLAAEGDALLLERATGTGDLAALARSGDTGDAEAARVLCRTGMRLHEIDDRPRPTGLVDLRRWFRELFLHAEEHPGRADGLYARASAEAAALLSSPGPDVVLHGDLHHGNVLDFGPHGWRAIDPKHIHGDPAFDFANILCNPDAATAAAPGRLERLLGVIADETGIDERRMLRWALAWAGLSAAWSERSGGDPAIAIGVGDSARRLLDSSA